MKKKVKSFIQKHHLANKGDFLIVALSGGADSVAMLHILHSLGYNCIAAHCNFHLRKEESMRDQYFVENFCMRMHIPLEVISFDTTHYAQEKHLSIEMAARELRYQWFEQLRKKHHAQYVATAHHLEDSTETILLNLIRGTGIKGLRGIQPKNGYIIRPILCLKKEEILQYLATVNEKYVTDSTNLETDYTRNKIRLQLLPMMKDINPSVADSIYKSGNHVNAAYNIYQDAIHRAKERVMQDNIIQIPLLLSEVEPFTLLYEIVSPLGFNSQQTEDLYGLLYGQSGKRIENEQWIVVKDRNKIIIEKKIEMVIPELVISECLIDDSFQIIKDKYSICIDKEKVKSPLYIRKVQTGDFFYPFGMKGRKKMSDYMIDTKYTLMEKERQLVLCSGQDIVWLIGQRVDRRFAVTPTTATALIISIQHE